MRINRRGLAIGLGALAATQGAAYLLYRKVSRERTAGRDGAFSYEALERSPIGLDARLQQRDAREVALRAKVGKPLLLHFWATWCEPCRVELPQLLGLEEPALVLVSTDDSWPVVDHFFDGHPPSTVVLDSRGEARRAFEITTLPDTYLLDGKGRPLARFHGAQHWSSDSARVILKRLLNS